MPYDLCRLESLPLRGKVSVIAALQKEKKHGNLSFTDWECSNQDHNRYMNQKSKNAKAKHRKKFKNRS